MFFNRSSTLLSMSCSSTFGILSLTFSYTLFSNSFACAGCIIFLRTTLLGSGSFLTGIPLQL